jgi:hypothetical protein
MCVCVCVCVCVCKCEATPRRGKGGKGTVPGTANLDTTWRRLKIPQYSLDRRLGEPHRQSGGSGEEKKFGYCRK